MFKKSDNEVRGTMSTAVASEYVRRMVAQEARGPGDTDGAMTRLEAKYGLSFWQLSHLRGGRAKTVDVGLYERIRAAFIDHCGRHAARLLHDAEMAQAVTPNDDVAIIESEIRALAARLAAAKSKAQRAVR